jgi:hypothetical protein
VSELSGDRFTPRPADIGSIASIADAIRDELTAPPRGGEDVCPLCHLYPAGSALCDSCFIAGPDVDFPTGPLSVITLVTKPSPLRDWMTQYKGRPADP